MIVVTWTRVDGTRSVNGVLQLYCRANELLIELACSVTVHVILGVIYDN